MDSWTHEDCWIAVWVFFKNSSISSMFRSTFLGTPFSSPFSTPFSTLAHGSSTSSSLSYPSMCPSTATPQGGLSVGRLAEQSPLTGYEPKSLIEVRSESTPIVPPSRRCSLDTNVNDLATTLEASEVCQTWDGRLHHYFLRSAK